VRSVLWWILVQGIVSSHAVGASVPFILEGAIPSRDGETHLHAHLSCHSAEGRGTAIEIDYEGALPGQVAMPLPPGGIWSCEVRAEGFWAPPRVVTVREGQAPIRLGLWEVGTLSARLLLADPTTVMPEQVSLRFREALPAAPAQGPPHRGAPERRPRIDEHTIACPVVDATVRCALPALVLDLRLRATGFISHFLWGRSLEAGKILDLGALPLRPGASVAGVLVAEEGVVNPKTARVHLVPLLTGTPAGAQKREQLRATELSARVNQRGFFHIQGVAPGTYALTAEQDGLAPARIAPVPVETNAETEIRRPLTLRVPARLEAVLDPPQDPYGGRWALALLAPGTGTGPMENLGSVPCGQEGLCARDGLAPGVYLLMVQDSRGMRWAQEEVVVARGGGVHPVHLDHIWLSGQVLLGEEPLPARLTFGGRHGREHIPFEADDEGHFTGVLPRAGEWEVLVEEAESSVSTTLEVSVEPSPEGGEVAVTLTLPDTRLRGQVVDADGEPAAGAVVQRVDGDPRFTAATETDGDGRFTFGAVREGTVVLEASLRREGRLYTAGPLAVTAEGGEAGGEDLRLALREVVEVEGQVVSTAGPVLGARVRLLPIRHGKAWPMASLPEEITGVDGRFRLPVPAEATELVVQIFPPGHVLTLIPMPDVPRRPLTLQVEENGGAVSLYSVPETNPPETSPTEMNPEETMLILWIEGHPFGEPILREWARFNGQGQGDPHRLRIPQLPPGSYTACRLPRQAVLQALLAGELAPSGGSCATGILHSFAELELQL